MRTKTSDAEPIKPSSAKSKIHNRLNFFCITIVIFNLLAILPFAYFFLKQDKVHKINILQSINRKLQISEMLNYPMVLRYSLESMFTPQETISIDMKYINVQKIEYMRQRAMQKDKDFEYVPAIIRYGNESFKVKIRLKGDRKIHYDDIDTASYRVKVKGGLTLFGMKTFSLHKPRARNYMYEWAYLRLMGYVGLMSPQYRFVKVNFNGKDQGLYALEEHYDKYLIERHRKREGPIIRFKEDDNNYQLAAVAPYVSKKWYKPENLPITKKAVYLLEGYRRGELTVSQSFDVDKLAMFFALSDLTGTHHGSVPKSLRFYCNPITSRLEPIPFDGHFGTISQPTLSSEIGISPERGAWIYENWREWFVSLFNDPDRFDPDFIRAYVAALTKVSSTTFLDNFFLEVDDEIDSAIISTYSELPLKDNVFSFGPAPFKFDKNIYYYRSKYIKSILSKTNIVAHLNAQSDKQIEIEVNRNDRHLPLEVVSLSCGQTVLEPASEDTFLVGTKPPAELETHRVSFPILKDQTEAIQASECNKINFRIVGQDKLRSVEVYPWPSYDHNFVKNDITRSAATYSQFDFIRTDNAKQELQIAPGTHTIANNLIFPSGYTVVAGPATKLILKNKALIFSRSPLSFRGSEESPIEITSHDNTGQGLTVIGASNTSYLEHVKITNLHNPSQQGWSIPGAVTFYESPVNMISVSVCNNQSEDAINIVRSHFELRQLHIADTFSDGLDVDFGKGLIYQSQIANTGNDGIDVSGSEIELQDVEILSAADKGISAGEASMISARTLKLQGNKLGVVAKDNSIVRIDGLDISKSQIAISAYQKKSEYGPGKIYIDNATFDGQGTQSLIERGSLLVLDGKDFPGQHKNVYNTLLALP